MGITFSAKELQSLNAVEREWISIMYPKLLKAIESKNKNEIKVQITKLNNKYPNSQIHDLLSAINFLRALRVQQIKQLEIESENKFFGLSSLRSTLVKCEINKREIYALLDTGADKSFVGINIAKLHGILHLTDLSDKWAKKAIGLGTKQFIGRIHCIHIGFVSNESFEIVFPLMVMNRFELSFLVLGLDFINWFQCSIDYRSKTIYLAKIGKTLKFICDQCSYCLSKSNEQNHN